MGESMTHEVVLLSETDEHSVREVTRRWTARRVAGLWWCSRPFIVTRDAQAMSAALSWIGVLARARHISQRRTGARDA